MCSLFGDTAKHLDSKSTAKCAVGCAGPACNRIPVLPTTTLSTAVKSNRPSQQVVEEEQGEGEGEGCDVWGGEEHRSWDWSSVNVPTVGCGAVNARGKKQSTLAEHGNGDTATKINVGQGRDTRGIERNRRAGREQARRERARKMVKKESIGTRK